MAAIQKIKPIEKRNNSYTKIPLTDTATSTKITQISNFNNNQDTETLNINNDQIHYDNWDTNHEYGYEKYKINCEIINYSNIKEDGFTPQGYTVVDDKTLITAYDSSLFNPEKTRIYIYDNNTQEYEGMIILDNHVHAGGVAYDEKNNILFITGSNKGNVYSFDYNIIKDCINNAKHQTEEQYVIDTSTGAAKTSYINNDIETDTMASINYFNGSLYSTTFQGEGTIYKIDYDIKVDANGNKIITSNIPQKNTGAPATQGMTFYHGNNGQDYMILSSSTTMSNSNLLLYKINSNGNYLFAGSLEIEHDGLEGIQCDSEGNIYGIFENGQQEVEKITSVSILSLSNTLSEETLKSEIIGAIMYDDLLEPIKERDRD